MTINEFLQKYRRVEHGMNVTRPRVLCADGFNHCGSCSHIGGYSGSFRKQPVNWIILGAESGNRKDKVVPRREWIDNIVQICDERSIPVFMKESLRGLMCEGFRQEFPWEVSANDA